MPHAVPTLALRLALRALLAGPGRLDAPAEVALRRAAGLAVDPHAEAEIDGLRARLAADTRAVDVVDYGAGSSRGDKATPRRVCDVAARAGTGPAWGRFLQALARELAPGAVLELGTNLGLGAAHLCAGLEVADARDPAGAPRRLVSLEGDPTFAELSRGALAALGWADRATVVTGRFADTLPDVLAAHGPFGLVFVDGHHAEAPALDYVAAVRPHLAPGAVVVLDDVEPTRPVRRAWTRLASEPGARRRYLGKLGLLQFPSPDRAAARGGAVPAAARSPEIHA